MLLSVGAEQKIFLKIVVYCLWSGLAAQYSTVVDGGGQSESDSTSSGHSKDQREKKRTTSTSTGAYTLRPTVTYNSIPFDISLKNKKNDVHDCRLRNPFEA